MIVSESSPCPGMTPGKFNCVSQSCQGVPRFPKCPEDAEFCTFLVPAKTAFGFSANFDFGDNFCLSFLFCGTTDDGISSHWATKVD